MIHHKFFALLCLIALLCLCANADQDQVNTDQPNANQVNTEQANANQEQANANQANAEQVAEKKIEKKKPNIILMVVDDMGYGDLGCYGNKTSRTPHIDSLANKGVKLTQLYVASPLCTPSRAAIMTGRYPVRSGMESNEQRFRVLTSPASIGGLPSDEITIAEQLKQHGGYSTALVGKWHLGINNGSHGGSSVKWDGYFPVFEQNGELLPVEQGFDSFYGLPVTNARICGNEVVAAARNPLKFILINNTNLSIAMGVLILTTIILKWYGLLSWATTVFFLSIPILYGVAFYFLAFHYSLLSPYACLLYRDKNIIEQPVNLTTLTERMNVEALTFIENHRDDPFFLYYAFVKLHTALHTSPSFRDRSGKGDFVDNVEELDWSVGQVLNKLEALGILDNTIIILTSDNGPHLEEGQSAGTSGSAADQHGVFRPLKGGKGTNWEGGVRVAGLIQYPSLIPHHESNHIVSTMDFFPTICAFAGIPTPSDRIIDGLDISSHLQSGKWSTDESSTSVSGVRPFLFHYCGNFISAVRYGHFKAHFSIPRVNSHESTAATCIDCCPSTVVCGCADLVLDQPLLYNLFEDPSESSPLDLTKYATVIKDIKTALAEEKKKFENVSMKGGFGVRSQLENLPRPWLFPCCGKDCKCTESESIST